MKLDRPRLVLDDRTSHEREIATAVDRDAAATRPDVGLDHAVSHAHRGGYHDAPGPSVLQVRPVAPHDGADHGGGVVERESPASKDREVVLDDAVLHVERAIAQDRPRRYATVPVKAHAAQGERALVPDASGNENRCRRRGSASDREVLEPGRDTCADLKSGPLQICVERRLRHARAGDGDVVAEYESRGHHVRARRDHDVVESRAGVRRPDGLAHRAVGVAGAVVGVRGLGDRECGRPGYAGEREERAEQQQRGASGHSMGRALRRRGPPHQGRRLSSAARTWDTAAAMPSVPVFTTRS